MNETVQIPKWFKAVGIIAIVWNLMGVLAYIAHLAMTPEMLNALPEAEQALYADIPMWANIAFAVAVWAGLIGSILLFLKKAFSFEILVASFFGVLIQMYHSFFVIDSIAVYGPGGAIMPIMVILIAAYLAYLGKQSKENHWTS